jgi:molecular chaperone GrpE
MMPLDQEPTATPATDSGTSPVPASGTQPDDGSGGPPGTPRGALPSGVSDPAEVSRQRDEYYERLLRTAAEFDNYRKRVERERREYTEYATVELIKELLPLLDDLERAVAAEAGAGGPEAIRKGIELIHRRLLDVLARRGVAVIDPVGADFDPHLHEAVARVPAAGRRDGEVVEVFARGYRLGDRLLRPAMVKVATS